MQAMYNLNVAGQPHPDMSALPNQYDAEICKGNYAPRDAEQMNIIMTAINWGRMAIFADMGCGKTFMGGYAAMWWKKHSPQFRGSNKVTLVLCPKSVTSEWVNQCSQFFGSRVTVFPDNYDFHRSDIVVANYEQLPNLLRFKESIGAVICDESQKIKNIKTAMFRNLCELLQGGIWHRLVMTGTAIKNKPDDLFTQLSIINPYAFNFSYDAMMKTYFFQVRTMQGIIYKFKETWAHLFRSIVQRNAVLVEATARPSGSETRVIPCKPTLEQKKYLAAIEEGTIRIVTQSEGYCTPEQQKAIDVALKNQLVKEQQVSSGFMVAADTTLRFSSAKMATAYNLLTGDWANELAICWVYFRETAQRMANAVEAAGETVGIIYGGMSKMERDRIINSFKAGKTKKLIAQISSMNAGLNLQCCHRDVFVELPWSPSDLEQALARTDRSGQKETCQHVFVYTEGTADELFIKAQQDKSRVNSATIRKRAKSSVLSKVKATGKKKKVKEPDPFELPTDEIKIRRISGRAKAYGLNI